MTDAMELPAVTGADLPAESWGDWALTQLGAALDGSMLRAMRLVVDSLMMPRPQDLPRLRASAEPFIQGELRDKPRRFFTFVDAPIEPLDVTGRYRRVIDGGAVVARRFATAYQSYPGIEHAPEDDAPAHDRLLVEHWAHQSERPRATVVALHGFSMGYPWMDSLAMFAAPLYAHGFDVALVTLPFHGPRTPKSARFSGERFAMPHVARLNEAVRQAVYEIHLLVTWLRRHSGTPVGLLGLSLGGYLSALMAGLTPALDFVVPMVPPACMGDLAWRFFSKSRHYRNRKAVTFSREELRAVYRVHSPLTYARQVDWGRVLIVAGRGDQIVPPEHPHSLWRHWEEPEIYWFSGSHLAPFRRGRLFAAIASHIDQCIGG
jgi:pimeloyl-ACP methyl ester carboxylesterase